jgi:Mn2+/Fe2+ NRAMP family transporter
MKKLLEITLGIVTSVGGFLEIGSIVTAAQAGSTFGFQLLWAVVLGGLCVIFLVEMSGRFSAISRHTIPAAMRERFGFPFFTVPLLVIVLVVILVLASEIGGACVALELISGVGFQWWALPVGLLLWFILWKGTFGMIEKGVSLLGLVTVAFIVGAFRLHPPWSQVAAGMIPSLPDHDSARYWFIAVSIIGASVSPYLLYFYSSGAIEDKWNESHLVTNRIVAGMGMGFGTTIAMAVLVLAAILFLPRGIQVDHYDQAALMLMEPMGRWGFILFAASLFIACLGAALEISLEVAYMVAQGFGWEWGENQRPIEEARFSLVYTVVILIGTLLMTTGIDPLKLTVLSMALTAASLPVAIGPFIVLMNDRRYVGKHVNSAFSNIVVMLIIALAFVLAVVTIPLEIFGS